MKLSLLPGRLVLVGAGKMGGAMLTGWLEGGIEPSRIVTLDPSPPADSSLLMAERGIRHNPPIDEITDAGALVIAVKPQMMDAALPPLRSLMRSRPLVVSVAAGKTIANLQRHLGADAAIVRAMPNTPAAIGRGITGMVAGRNVSPTQASLAEALLAAVGEVVRLDDESLIDAVTAVSGSGPAYIFYLTECLTEAGEAAGLPPDLAERLARATVAGAGELMRQSGLPAATLRQNVTSPQGTTFAALEVLMAEEGLGPLMRKAVGAAARRSRELAG